MSVANALLLSIGTVAALVAGKVLVSLLSKEIEGRMDQLGYAILRLARRRLPNELRASLHDEEWLPELDSILERHRDRPVTKLVWSLRFSVPLLLGGAVRTARIVQPRPPFARIRPALRAVVALAQRSRASTSTSTLSDLERSMAMWVDEVGKSPSAAPSDIVFLRGEEIHYIQVKNFGSEA
ncbi:hypothetical protein ACWEKT_02595 [Nocardia takedensis]